MNKEKNYIVYIHINKTPSKNGIHKRYFGITCQNINRRWRNNGNGYKTRNRKGKYTYFYNAIKKYGWNNFEHKVLIHGLTKEQAEKWEQKLIAYYHTNNSKYGYNGDKGGKGGNSPNEYVRKRISESQKKRFKNLAEREKISLAKKKINAWANEKNPMYNKHLYGVNNYNAVSVVCILNEKVYNTLKECSEYENRDISSIIKHCKGRYKNKPQEFMYNTDWILLNNKQKQEKINKIKDYYDGLKIIRLKDGKIYNSISQCSKDNNVSENTIIRHCNNRLKIAQPEYIYYKSIKKI